MISGNKVKGEAAAFVRVEGADSKAVKVTKNKLYNTKKQIEIAAGAKQEAAVYSAR
jgi:hypothetical protein